MASLFAHLNSRKRLNLKSIDVGALKVAYHQEGSGSDLLLVVTPFILATTYMVTVKELRPFFRVTVVELPGSGRSSQVSSKWDFPEYAEFIFEFARRLQLNQPWVLGHSHSGAVAAVAISKHPEYFRGGMLADPAGACPSNSLFKILLARLWDAVLEPGLTLTGTHHIVYNLVWHPRNILRQIWNCRGSRVIEEQLASTERPLLLAWGKHDHTMPVICADRWKKRWYNSEVVISQRGSHDWILTRPRAFAEAVVAFVKKYS